MTLEIINIIEISPEKHEYTKFKVSVCFFQVSEVQEKGREMRL